MRIIHWKICGRKRSWTI